MLFIQIIKMRLVISGQEYSILPGSITQHQRVSELYKITLTLLTEIILSKSQLYIFELKNGVEGHYCTSACYCREYLSPF